jgi:hypothetical protein
MADERVERALVHLADARFGLQSARTEIEDRPVSFAKGSLLLAIDNASVGLQRIG